MTKTAMEMGVVLYYCRGSDTTAGRTLRGNDSIRSGCKRVKERESERESDKDSRRDCTRGTTAV